MSHNQTQLYCPNCEGLVLAQKREINHILHLILVILTVGIWVIVWFLLLMAHDNDSKSWRCQHCGNLV
jgi:hypothetical protein